MKNVMKKGICLFACAVLATSGVVGELPLVHAETVQETTNETTNAPIQVGDSVYATTDGYGVLTISGDGDMWENRHNDGYKFADYYYNIIGGGAGFYGDGSYSRDEESFDFEGDCPWFGAKENEISSVVFSEGVTNVGSHAFMICSSKRWHSSYPSGASVYVHTGHRGLNSVTSVKLSSTIKTIGEGAFYGMPVLKSIEIPSNVTTIEPYAFLESALTSVKLNEGLETIGEYAFAGTKLTGINIPGTVKTIESNTFTHSTLNNVTINKGTKIIKKDAFGTNASNVKFYSKDVVIMEGAFASGSTFVCYKGSTADKYAKNHDISVKYISDKPSKAGKPTVSSKSKKLYITCKTMSGVDGYKIRYADNSAMKNAETEFGKKVTIVGLKKGKKYYVQVCAYKKDSKGKAVYGAWSDKVAITIK